MAAGDTISGQVRYIRENQAGDRYVVAGPFASVEMDQDTFNQKKFLNLGLLAQAQGASGATGASPFGAANSSPAPEGIFHPGEKLIIQHKSASLAEAIDYDADEYLVSVLERDLNTDIVQQRTLTVADTDLSANPTSSTSEWVTFFEDTVPDRRRWALAGHQKAAAVEVA